LKESKSNPTTMKSAKEEGIKQWTIIILEC
jgi:hypothetical protein